MSVMWKVFSANGEFVLLGFVREITSGSGGRGSRRVSLGLVVSFVRWDFLRDLVAFFDLALLFFFPAP